MPNTLEFDKRGIRRLPPKEIKQETEACEIKITVNQQMLSNGGLWYMSGWYEHRPVFISGPPFDELMGTMRKMEIEELGDGKFFVMAKLVPNERPGKHSAGFEYIIAKLNMRSLVKISDN